MLRIKASASGMLRTELYLLMYEVAKKHRDLAKQVAGKARNEEIKESMVSILFSFTCLEAHINAIGRDRLGRDWQKYEGNSVGDKWMGVSKRLASKKHGEPWDVFNKRREPFASFLELKMIREDYLVHWKAPFSEGVKTKYGNTGAAAINTLNYERAEWALNIVKEMIHKLHDNIDDPLPLGWL